MFRVLLSCASAMVRDELFEPGVHTLDDARKIADRIMAASPGVIAYVVPSGANAREVLQEKEWI